MMLIGKIKKAHGGLWAAECAVIGAFTQGKSRANACEMLADCIEVQSGRDGFRVSVTEGRRIGDDAYEVTVDSEQPEALIAELLKYQRLSHKLKAADVAKLLGSSNVNAYAAYEQGKREPSVGKLRELLGAIAPELELTVGPRLGPRAAKSTKAKAAKPARRRQAP